MIPFWTCQNSFSNLADFNTASCALSLADFVVFSSPISTFLDKKRVQYRTRLRPAMKKMKHTFGAHHTFIVVTLMFNNS